MGETLNEKRKDAGTLIKEILEKIPEEKRIEALRIIEGFALATRSECRVEKAG